MPVSDKEFKKVCHASKSMNNAAAQLGIKFSTFKRRAMRLDCYKPNQAGKGTSKKRDGISLLEILAGKHPQYQTFKLKRRLLAAGILEDKCSACGLQGQWNGKPLSCELEHKNGDASDHRLTNIEMLCPNCHSQTRTYRGLNKRLKHITGR